MEVFVDADACPVVRIVEQAAKARGIPVTLLCDTSHVLHSDYSRVLIIGAGADAVDLALVNLCRRGDIVVTQDYGVAAMALGKGTYGIHQSGNRYTQDNIQALLMERHLNQRARRGGIRSKGPKKRTAGDDERFAAAFAQLLEEAMDG